MKENGFFAALRMTRKDGGVSMNVEKLHRLVDRMLVVASVLGLVTALLFLLSL